MIVFKIQTSIILITPLGTLIILLIFKITMSLIKYQILTSNILKCKAKIMDKISKAMTSTEHSISIKLDSFEYLIKLKYNFFRYS